MREFRDLHPAVLFLYYIVVILVTAMTLQPIMVFISFIGAVLYYGTLSEREEYIKSLCFYLLVFITIVCINPLFSHNGETILFYLNDNPITKESFLYGVSMGIMVAAILLWCKCYEKVMTTDKFLYLFGKAVPKLSITISLAIRFIPVYKRQAENVSDVQRIMGIEKKYGKAGARLRVYDSVLGWAMENSVDTADAMSARGFGLKGRTSYSIFRFGILDCIILVFILFYLIVYIVGAVEGRYVFHYYPSMDALAFRFSNAVFYIVPGIGTMIPFLVTFRRKNGHH